MALENEAMYNQLQQHPDRDDLEKDLQFVQMPKPRGVADRTQEDRRIHRESRVRHNIYGHPLRSPKHVPFFHEVDFSDVSLCKLGSRCPTFPTEDSPHRVLTVSLSCAGTVHRRELSSASEIDMFVCMRVT